MDEPHQIYRAPVVAADDPRQHYPVMQSSVQIQRPDFGLAWLGVGALLTIAGLAIVHGRRHEDEARAQAEAQAQSTRSR